ncbi:MAG: hypothetical protein R6W84_13845, partial [Promethearchaeia archaeon]
MRKRISNYRNWRCIIHFINNELVHADLQRVCLFIMILNCKKKSLTGFDLIKQITQLKKTEEYEWLNEVTASSVSQAVLNLDNAYKKFFKENKGFPKFKSKKSNLSTQFPSSDGRNKVDFDAGLLKVTKF